MESPLVFNVGLLFLMNIMKHFEDQSLISFPRHFLRTDLEFSVKIHPFQVVFFQEMFADNGMFVFLYTLMEVTACVTDIICIAQITFEFINHILLVH